MTKYTIRYDTFSLEDICTDRRQIRRSIDTGRIIYRAPGKRGFRPAPVIECTTTGARVILGPTVQSGDKIMVKLESSMMALQGEARVAWTQQMENGHKVAGLEFLTVRRRRA